MTGLEHMPRGHHLTAGGRTCVSHDLFPRGHPGSGEHGLLNARPLRNVPGNKADVLDAEWICQLAGHGQVRPSFVPPRSIRGLRDLARYGKAQIEARGREAQRLAKVVQDAGPRCPGWRPTP